MRAAPRGALLAALVLFACERSRDHAVEKVVESAIEANGREASVAIDRAHGSITVTLGQARVPAGWPAAVPVYGAATKAKVVEGGPDRQRVTVSTDDSAKDLAEFYRRALADGGWSLQVADARDWSGERGSERIRVRVVPRDSVLGGSRAEIEYRAGGGKP